jgi:predicted small metal-binding protein
MIKKSKYKQLACREFGMDCDFIVQAETGREAMKDCREHVCRVHGKCRITPDLEARVKTRITTVLL